MRKLTTCFALVLFTYSFNLHAEGFKFKIPEIRGKLNTTNLVLTDLQTVISCNVSNQGNRKQLIRYPQTEVKKLDGPFYALKIKSTPLETHYSLQDLLSCVYKLIVIGKNKYTHWPTYGEIILAGKESGTMNESEIQIFLDPNQLTKILNEKIKELIIFYGKDGGIEEGLVFDEK